LTTTLLATFGALASGLVGALWGGLFACLDGKSGRVILGFALTACTWGALAGAVVGGLTGAFAQWVVGGPADEAT
jgi:hypothetical protein